MKRLSHFFRYIAVFLIAMMVVSNTGALSCAVAIAQNAKKPDACGFSCCCYPGKCTCKHEKAPSGSLVFLESSDCSPIKKSPMVTYEIKDTPILLNREFVHGVRYTESVDISSISEFQTFFLEPLPQPPKSHLS